MPVQHKHWIGLVWTVFVPLSNQSNYAGRELEVACHQAYNQPSHLITVHVPVNMPMGFEYLVTRKENLGRDFQVLDQNKVFRSSYREGRATIFNSWHYHNVHNGSTVPRLSLMFYADLGNPAFQLKVTKALASYAGPNI